jgi:hypothetical protein
MPLRLSMLDQAILIPWQSWWIGAAEDPVILNLQIYANVRDSGSAFQNFYNLQQWTKFVFKIYKYVCGGGG